MLKYSSSNPTQHTIFFSKYIPSGSYSHPYFGQFFYLVCRYLEKKMKRGESVTLRIWYALYTIPGKSSWPFIGVCSSVKTASACVLETASACRTCDASTVRTQRRLEPEAHHVVARRAARTGMSIIPCNRHDLRSSWACCTVWLLVMYNLWS